MVDVLYSLANVSQRFDRLALDPLHIRDLDMTINSLYNKTCSIDTKILSNICQKVVPRIHHQVHKLTVDQYSMKAILLAGNYPQLYSLSLINFGEEILYQYLTDDLILRDLLTKQITHLNIDIEPIRERSSETISNIFGLILSLCQKLTVFNFCDMFLTLKCLTPVFYLLSGINISSTLLKLKINVAIFIDCLYLLDGRLDSLSTLIINVYHICDPIIDIGSKKQLPKLKCFSLTTFNHMYDYYDSLIVPLICRMTNLEQLELHLSIVRFNSTYVDGFQLYDQFLIYMTQLNTFTFNINTEVINRDVTLELPSNEDIQRSFIGRGYKEVASYVHTISMNTSGKCHIYSLPYELKHFVNLDNCFQGGMFHKVRYLTMRDKDPFEYKLIKLISQDFPFLEFLCISNDRPQKDKVDSSTSITFPYLTFLDLQYAHYDYAELFLLKKNAHLPRLLNFCIKYKSLTTITNNFTIDATHFNFGILRTRDVCQSVVPPENFCQYYPLL